MAVSTSSYFIFLTGVFLLYWPVARLRPAALGVLLFANYFFYAKASLAYLILLPAAGIVDYFIARTLGHWKDPLPRRLLVVASLLLNIGILVSFKYMPWLLENWAAWTASTPMAWSWVLPLGLSFYCFQAIGYVLDVYRRDAQPVRGLLAYLTSVSFFPTTLAGPITPVAKLAPQMEKPRELGDVEAGQALYRIALGLAKKLLIADYLAENLVNRVFDFPNLYSGMETLVAVYAYALQLYFDFSGYTDIVIGSALLLGFKLPENFNQPYAAKNLADFWRRWHISLSNWLRDYVFFALPGKRTAWMPYVAVVVTMVIGGLWHGPSWNFIVWGLLHGVGQAVLRGWQHLPVSKRFSGRAWDAAATVLTVHFVCFAWVFFRASTWTKALEVLARIGSGTVSFDNVSTPVAFILAVAVVGHWFPPRWWEFARDRFAAAPFYAQAAAMVALIAGLQYINATGAAPFIYTRF